MPTKASAKVIIPKMASSDQELLPGADEFSGAMRREMDGNEGCNG
jgi:hypothetical protein